MLFADAAGSLGSQVFVNEYGQLDGSISYAINDSFTAFANIVNLTDEEQHMPERHLVTRDRFYSGDHLGVRYSVGIRETS